MSGFPPPDPGFCVCGRPLPADALSEWACSEVCQSAWMHHHADPDVYPHPKVIREAADQRAAEGFRDRPVRVHVPGPAGDRLTSSGLVGEGTEINVDGETYVRVGGHWLPAGAWTPVREGLVEQAGYRRWCPHCRQRVDSAIYPASDRQECAVCGHLWQGRPLLGQFERRGEPWPGMRMRLFDGQRSAVALLAERFLTVADTPLGDADAAILARWWLRLERQLCGGYADADQPDARQQRRQQRRLARDRHFCADLAP